MAERLTFCKGSNDDRNKRGHEENANAVQSKLVARTPQVDRDPFEEFRDCPLAHPNEQSVEDACSQHELRAQFAMPNLFFCVVDADSSDIVSAIDQHYVHKAHACEQWN